jgi:hypothetical protein
MATKVTFTLDEATLARLADAAQRLAKPKSEIVREAIHDLHERIGRLSERERVRMLHVFDEMVPQIPPGSIAAVENELRTIRETRRAGGRRARAASAR